MREIPTHAYLGIKKCGCFGFVGGDKPVLAKDNGKDAAWIVRHGGTVERLPLEEAKARLAPLPHGCEECSPKKAKNPDAQVALFGGAA